MTINEYTKIDKLFDETIFLENVNTMFKKLLSSITLNNIDQIKHYFNEEIYNKTKQIIDSNNNKNQLQIYELLNVKDSNINKFTEFDNYYEIEVLLNSRYIEYIIDKDTSKVISGNTESRINVDYLLTLTKSKNTKEIKSVFKCPGCGASVDIDETGICDYCDTSFDLSNYSWIITKIEKIN